MGAKTLPPPPDVEDSKVVASQRVAVRTLGDWLEYIDRVHPRDIEMGLQRVAEVALEMNLLPVAKCSVIVAGTNGKGSTCVATEAVLGGLGWRVGTTISPHISSFNERIRVGSETCDDVLLCEGFNAIEVARGHTPLTYFEFSALLALYCFKRAEVDVAILEVGLGGRLDAFNIVDADIAIVTSIGLDHMDYLGANEELIGAEKAGVFRQRQEVVLGPQVSQSVIDRAAALDCVVFRYGRDFSSQPGADAAHWRYASGAIEPFELPRGGLAPLNCALGIQAATLVHAKLSGSVPLAGVVASAMDHAMLAGRMEQICVGQRNYLLDVAHNPAAARFLAEEIAVLYPGRRLTALFGSLRDKDSRGVVEGLSAVVKQWIAIDLPGNRGLSADELKGRLPKSIDCLAAGAISVGLGFAHSATDPGDVILVCGSFAVVDTIRSGLQDWTPA